MSELAADCFRYLQSLTLSCQESDICFETDAYHYNLTNITLLLSVSIVVFLLIAKCGVKDLDKTNYIVLTNMQAALYILNSFMVLSMGKFLCVTILNYNSVSCISLFFFVLQLMLSCQVCGKKLPWRITFCIILFLLIYVSGYGDYANISLDLHRLTLDNLAIHYLCHLVYVGISTVIVPCVFLFVFIMDSFLFTGKLN